MKTAGGVYDPAFLEKRAFQDCKPKRVQNNFQVMFEIFRDMLRFVKSPPAVALKDFLLLFVMSVAIKF